MAADRIDDAGDVYKDEIGRPARILLGIGVSAG
jgi:hypothetical protein